MGCQLFSAFNKTSQELHEKQKYLITGIQHANKQNIGTSKI